MYKISVLLTPTNLLINTSPPSLSRPIQLLRSDASSWVGTLSSFEDPLFALGLAAKAFAAAKLPTSSEDRTLSRLELEVVAVRPLEAGSTVRATPLANPKPSKAALLLPARCLAAAVGLKRLCRRRLAAPAAAAQAQALVCALTLCPSPAEAADLLDSARASLAAADPAAAFFVAAARPMAPALLPSSAAALAAALVAALPLPASSPADEGEVRCGSEDEEGEQLEEVLVVRVAQNGPGADIRPGMADCLPEGERRLRGEQAEEILAEIRISRDTQLSPLRLEDGLDDEAAEAAARSPHARSCAALRGCCGDAGAAITPCPGSQQKPRAAALVFTIGPVSGVV